MSLKAASPGSVNGRGPFEVDEKSSATDREAMKGTLSAGEFGGVLRAIFSPASQAGFASKETDALNGGTVQVFHSGLTMKILGFTPADKP